MKNNTVVVIGCAVALLMLFDFHILLIAAVVAIASFKPIMEDYGPKMVTLRGMEEELRNIKAKCQDVEKVRGRLLSQMSVWSNYKSRQYEITYAALYTTNPVESMREVIARAEPEFKKTCSRLYDLVLINCQSVVFNHAKEAERLLSDNQKLLDDLGDALFGVASLNIRHSTEYVNDYASALREMGQRKSVT